MVDKEGVRLPSNAVYMDYYEVLGVDNKANADAIRTAYRKEAMKCHPDKNPGDKKAEDRFKEINEAYQVLSDERKRALYDSIKPPVNTQQPEEPQQQTDQGDGILNSLFKSVKDIFKKRQGIRREKPPTQDEVKVSTLRAQIRNAKSINEMAQVVNLWFESNADSTKANFFPDFPGITVDTLHQLFTATQQDPRNAEILQALLEQVTMVVSDVTAEHIITVIKQSPRGSDQPNTSKSTPRETPPTNPDPSPQPRRREQPTPIKVEDENEVFEILLGDLFRAKTLEATIEALQNWIRKYDKFQNTTPLIFSSFSPTQLLAELRAYASGTLNSLEEGTYIQGTGAVAMGMKEKIAEHLRKKSVINRKKVVIPPRAEEVGKPKTIAPEAAPVMPISEDLIGTPEMLRFRAELLAAKTLEAVLVLLNDCKILDEAITFKPQINAKPLARMLDAIINRKMEYKKIGFFNEVLLNFTEPDLSPVAKHLLQLAQNR